MANKYDKTQYADMTAEQRVKYVGNFQRWYANRSAITDCIAQTNALDADAEALFDEGTALMQAWHFGESFLDAIHSVPKTLCVDRLMYLADLAKKKIQTITPSQTSQTLTPDPLPSKGRGSSQQQTRQDDKKEKAEGKSEKSESAQDNAQQANNSSLITPHSSLNEVLPVGKLHLDQISYLLSPQLAERVKNLKQILDIRDAESNIAKQLASDGKSQHEIAPHSEAAVKAQEEATAIYERVDDELAEYVATYRYIRTHKAEPGQQETAFKATISAIEEAAKPFGTLDRLIAALTPYYEKCNKDGRIDRLIREKGEGKSEKSESAGDNSSLLTPHSSLESEAPAYDQKDYKRIWTYVSRQDVAHTEKRLRKMRECIDEAIAAGMPNIEAMETFYAKEAELVLAEQEKKLNDGEPSLL